MKFDDRLIKTLHPVSFKGRADRFQRQLMLMLAIDSVLGVDHLSIQIRCDLGLFDFDLPLSERTMKLKQLESYLEDLQQFEKPKIELEQYPTGPHIAARMLFMIENSFGDLCNKTVADLGCGCGTLAIGSVMMGALHVLGIDVDEDSLNLAKVNCEEFEVEVDFIQSDLRHTNLQRSLVDTVVMNPPFGTRRKGADMEFLQFALKLARRSVYSLHKSSTREHISKVALKEFGAKKAEVVCQLRYDIPAMYKFHKKQEKDIEVDLWRFQI